MGGLVDFAVQLPDFQLEVAELHRQSGVELASIRKILPAGRKTVLAEGQHAWTLGIAAGRVLLERNDVDAAEIGTVIYAGSSEWGRPFWSPAAKVAAELGVEKAHCFEVSNFCNAGLTAIGIADDLLGRGRGSAALVVFGDRLSQLVEHDPRSLELFNFGDAGAAVLLSNDNVNLRFLGSSMRTDPAWVDYYSGEIIDNVVRVQRSGDRSGLGAAYVQNFLDLTDETLTRIGKSITDVSYVLINHGDRNIHERYLRELGISEERSIFQYDQYGHLGGVDTLVGLDRLRTHDRLNPGDLLLFVTSGMGFSWGVTAMEVVR